MERVTVLVDLGDANKFPPGEVEWPNVHELVAGAERHGMSFRELNLHDPVPEEFMTPGRITASFTFEGEDEQATDALVNELFAGLNVIDVASS